MWQEVANTARVCESTVRVNESTDQAVGRRSPAAEHMLREVDSR